MARVWVEVGAGRWRLMDADDGASTTTEAAPFVRPDRIGKDEQRKIALQLGVRVDSESALRRHLKDNGMRLRESGDRMDKIRKERKQWLRDTEPGKRGKNPTAGPSGYSHY